jgi:hypothetical protein
VWYYRYQSHFRKANKNKIPVMAGRKNDATPPETGTVSIGAEDFVLAMGIPVVVLLVGFLVGGSVTNDDESGEVVAFTGAAVGTDAFFFDKGLKVTVPSGEIVGAVLGTDGLVMATTGDTVPGTFVGLVVVVFAGD